LYDWFILREKYCVRSTRKKEKLNKATKLHEDLYIVIVSYYCAHDPYVFINKNIYSLLATNNWLINWYIEVHAWCMLAIYTHDTWHIYIAIYASAVARGAKPSCHIEIKQDVIMIRRAYSISFRTTPAGRQESRCAANSDPTMTPSLPPMDLICGLGVCQQPLHQVAGPGPHSRSWTWTWHDRPAPWARPGLTKTPGCTPPDDHIFSTWGEVWSSQDLPRMSTRDR
jgi:hypothetical protein